MFKIMIELILFQIIGLILFFFVVKKSLRIKTYISNIVLGLNALAIIMYPVTFLKFETIPNFARIYSLIFGIVLPIIIIVSEHFTQSTYDETLIKWIVKWYKVTKKNKKAKDVLIKYLEKNTGSSILHKELAIIYENEGGTRKAIDEYIKVVEIEKTDYDSYFKIIKLMHFLDKKEETKELLVNLITSYKYYPKAYNLYANMIEEEGNLKEAAKIYEEGIKYNPEEKKLLYNLACVYADLNEFSLAKKNLEKCLNIDTSKKSKSITALNLAQISMIERDFIDAKLYLEKAKKNKGIEDISYYELAKINLLERDEEKALENLNKALDINPNIIKKINSTEIFEDIIEQTVVKLELIPQDREIIEDRQIRITQKLEEALELIMIMDRNENADRAHAIFNNIIREKVNNTTLEQMEKQRENTDKFIEKHIENVDESFEKYFYGEKGKHDKNE